MKQKTKRSIESRTQEGKKFKAPWWTGLEVKDLIKPITIRRVRILQAGLVALLIAAGGYFTWQNYFRGPTGEEMVADMIQAAGGMDAWNNLKEGQFLRTRNLYSEAGDLMETKRETFFFKKTNEGLKLQVKSMTNDGEEVWIGKDQDGYWATKDRKAIDPQITARGLGMMCDSKWCEPLCASSMAFFRFSMPFKLTDNGVIPEVVNPVSFDGEKMQVLDVTYDPNVGKDRWVFYVSPEDGLIHKIEYHNRADNDEVRPEEIFWSDHREAGGITFSHKWTRYWSNGSVMEEYVFSDVDFNTSLADNFFERPEGPDWLSLK